MTLGKAILSERYCQEEKFRTISGGLEVKLGNIVLVSTHWVLGSPHPPLEKEVSGFFFMEEICWDIIAIV